MGELLWSEEFTQAAGSMRDRVSTPVVALVLLCVLRCFAKVVSSK